MMTKRLRRAALYLGLVSAGLVGILCISRSAVAQQSRSSYSIFRLNSDGNEGYRHTFRIVRTCNLAPGSVQFSTFSGSALSGIDFSPYTATRTFKNRQNEDVVYVDSRPDINNEGTERFNVSISKVNNTDTITTASTFGQISNEFPPGSQQPDFKLDFYRQDNIYWKSGNAPGRSNLGKSKGNCTWYASGRAKQWGRNAANVDKLNGFARDWGIKAKSNKLRTSTNPEPGAIAHWNYGHVAIVERVDGNSIWISESSYSTIPGPSDFLFKYRNISLNSSSKPNLYIMP